MEKRTHQPKKGRKYKSRRRRISDTNIGESRESNIEFGSNNIADELYKKESEKLKFKLHEIITKIWEEEEVTVE